MSRQIDDASLDAALAEGLSNRRARKHVEKHVVDVSEEPTDAELAKQFASDPSSPWVSNERTSELRNAVARIKLAQPDLVAKQVHAELLGQSDLWRHVTLSEVKCHCSKLTKANPAEMARPTGRQHGACPLIPTRARDKIAQPDLKKEPNTRDAEQFKVSRPGLPTHGTTLHRGDRLGTAAERGDTQQVNKLLKKGVDPNFQNSASGVTPLGVACERGHTGVVRALLDSRASPEIATTEGYRPIHIASQFGQKEVVELLLRRGRADVHARCPLQDTFPLLLAVNFNFVDVARVLVEASADVNMASVSRGLSPLHYAISAEAVALLVAAHADVDACDNPDGVTPLHTCCIAGAPAVCVALLACGADPTIDNDRGFTCVEIAIETGGNALKCAHAILGYVANGKQIRERHVELSAEAISTNEQAGRPPAEPENARLFEAPPLFCPPDALHMLMGGGREARAMRSDVDARALLGPGGEGTSAEGSLLAIEGPPAAASPQNESDDSAPERQAAGKSAATEKQVEKSLGALSLGGGKKVSGRSRADAGISLEQHLKQRVDCVSVDDCLSLGASRLRGMVDLMMSNANLGRVEGDGAHEAIAEYLNL